MREDIGKKHLTILELQKAIKRIDHKHGTVEQYMLKLMEEVGELAEVVRKDSRMQEEHIKGTIEEELQDVLYYVICLANYYDIDLEQCVYVSKLR